MAAGDELRQLSRDLAKGIPVDKVAAVVTKGAVNIRAQLKGEASASSHFRLASQISYDLRFGFTGIEAEVGPEKRGAGNLANIAYFGGSHGGGGTLPDPRGALDAETPKFIKALEDLAGEVLA